MKCPACGAEINDNNRYCDFCGTEITYEMKREQEQLNKSGCPNCGSSHIEFSREKQGEVKGKKGTAVVRSTVGVCKDCGHTWHVRESGNPVKKRKTWLWVLGWIFIFPLPLTILLLRPTNKLNKKIRYAIIAAAWIVYIGWMIGQRATVGKDAPQSVGTENTYDAKNDIYNEKEKEESFVEETVTEEKEEVDTIKPDDVSDDKDMPEINNDADKENEASDESAEEAESKDSDRVDPELKAFLDSYEAFMDEYCEFMQSYDASDTMMLLKYTEMMTKYVEMVEKADSYNSDEMSAADSLYYLQVMNRVNEKLAKVALEQ